MDLDALVVGSEFDVAENYAHTLTYIFVCMFYAGGLPILIVVLTGYLFCRFWIDKYMVLRHCKVPTYMSEYLHETVIKILPYSLSFHLIFSLWQYSAPDVFPNEII